MRRHAIFLLPPLLTFPVLFGIPGAPACRRRAPGRRVAVLTSADTAGMPVADACGLSGFDVRPLNAATADRNPADLALAGLGLNPFRTARDMPLQSPGCDVVVTVLAAFALRRRCAGRCRARLRGHGDEARRASGRGGDRAVFVLRQGRGMRSGDGLAVLA